MHCIIFEQVMDVFQEKSVYEVRFSTNSKNCHDMGGGKFQLCLKTVTFKPISNMKIGIKDLHVPLQRKTVTFKLFYGLFYERLDPLNIKEISIIYKSYEELAFKVQFWINSMVKEKNAVCMNFTTSHSKHLCPKNGYSDIMEKTTLTYCYDKFILKKASDYVLYLSSNIVNIFNFTCSTANAFEGLLNASENYYMSTDDCFFLTDFDKSVVIVLYDSIVCNTVMECGSELPILYSGDVSKACWGDNKLISVKMMLNNNMTMFNIGIFNSNMMPFRNVFDIKKNPISFTIVFMK